MTIEPTTVAVCPQPLKIEWRDQGGPLTVVFFRQEAAPVRICGTAARFGWGKFDLTLRRSRDFGVRHRDRRARSWAGFTLLELLVVLAIIGLMASLTLPHLRGFSKSNSMNAATRQMLDDVAFARQRAIVNRSTVYMVFVPPAPWNYIAQASLNALSGRSLSNLVQSQYRGYALLSLRTVGDQPGQWHPSFLTDWKTLPTGVFIAPSQFVPTNRPHTPYSIYTSNTLANTFNIFQSGGFSNTVTTPLPFPTLQSYVAGLPYIAFSPSGTLVDEYGNPAADQFIPLTSGGILYPSDDNGPLFETPLITENPVGESSNNAHLIYIDRATARARLERNQF